MTQDAQVRKLFSLLSAGHSLRVSSLKTGMDEKTARKYRKANRMPSELSACHDWRTRPDPFATVWDRVQKQLSENPGLQGKVLFAWLQGEYPGQFQNGQLRTFQRGVRRWDRSVKRSQKRPDRRYHSGSTRGGWHAARTKALFSARLDLSRSRWLCGNVACGCELGVPAVFPVGISMGMTSVGPPPN